MDFTNDNPQFQHHQDGAVGHSRICSPYKENDQQLTIHRQDATEKILEHRARLKHPLNYKDEGRWHSKGKWSSYTLTAFAPPPG